MTQPQDPRKQPLQDDEIALARVLRALPAGEPPAGVDAAILRAATDAVSPGRRRPPGGLRWLPTWAIGTAAAAVLAVGIGVQLRPPLAPEPESGSVPVSEAVKPLPQARERLSVDLIEPDRAVSPPPASAPPQEKRSTRTAPPPPPAPPETAAPPASPPAPVAAAEPFPASAADAPLAEARLQEEDAAPAVLDRIEVSGSRVRSEATDQARRMHQESFARRAQAQADTQAAARPDEAAREASAPGANAASSLSRTADEAPPAAAAPMAGAPARDSAAEAAGPSATARAILPPVADDAILAPGAWLERIRERRRQGDIASARASLRLFVTAHPEAPVPSDLDRLR